LDRISVDHNLQIGTQKRTHTIPRMKTKQEAQLPQRKRASNIYRGLIV